MHTLLGNRLRASLVICAYLAAVACGSPAGDPAVESSALADACGTAPPGPDGPSETLPGLSAYNELMEDLRQELRGQLGVPLAEKVTEYGPVLQQLGLVDDPDKAWDALWVHAALDPPIPLRLLDELMPLFPPEVELAGYAELDDGYPMQVFARTASDLRTRFESLAIVTTTTTAPPGQGPPPGPNASDWAELADGEWDLRLVVLAYGIPARLIRDEGYSGLPLRELVYGVEVDFSPQRSMPKPIDELFNEAAGWRFCRAIASGIEEP